VELHRDPKQVVADGYDQIAERFAAWSTRIVDNVRDRYTDILLDTLPRGARVLELGCGSGSSGTTQALANRFDFTGIDISARQIALAMQCLPPGTRLLHADATQLTLPPASFDGVAAFYCFTHIPREQQGPLITRVAGWLRPGGLLIASLGARSDPGTFVVDWLGAPMFFSGYASSDSRALIERAELEVIAAQDESIDEEGVSTTFFWVVARKQQTTLR